MNQGTVLSVRGSVVDVGFDTDLPPIYSLLRSGTDGEIVIEVLAQRGAQVVRGMSEKTASLRRKIASAGELQSVVRTMKAMAASSIGQYERSVRALADYARTVELGLGACLREGAPVALPVTAVTRSGSSEIGAVVFGSDQGLVGQFNDAVADHGWPPAMGGH